MSTTDIQSIKKEAARRMHGAVEVLQKELAGLRTGRASVSLLEPVTVDAYGSAHAADPGGTIAAPEPRMLTVQVWDRGLVKAVEKAIREAGLGLNPASDGQIVRVPIPELNEERRVELTKVAHATPRRRASPCATSAATPWTSSRRRRRTTRSRRTSIATWASRSRS